MTNEQYFTKADMGRRWGVSPQRINNWEHRHPEFPQPVFRLGNGNIPVYTLEDVERYERVKGLKKGE